MAISVKITVCYHQSMLILHIILMKNTIELNTNKNKQSTLNRKEVNKIYCMDIPQNELGLQLINRYFYF